MDTQLIPLTPEYDAALAALVRTSLEEHHLDIPGTVYFDKGLDRLSEYYSAEGRAYYMLTRGGRLIGGIGLAPFEGFEHCCELQKLYLDASERGSGLGYKLIAFIEQRAAELGYERVYLETHTNLQAALHIYEKAGYRIIPRPASVVHSTMNRFLIKDTITPVLGRGSCFSYQNNP